MDETSKSVIFSKNDIDLGTIILGKPYYFNDVTVQNIGKNPIKVSKIVQSCGCLSASLEKDILSPGESQKFSIGIKNDTASGKRNLQIVLLYEDGSASILTVHVNVVSDVSFEGGPVPLQNNYNEKSGRPFKVTLYLPKHDFPNESKIKFIQESSDLEFCIKDVKFSSADIPEFLTVEIHGSVNVVSGDGNIQDGIISIFLGAKFANKLHIAYKYTPNIYLPKTEISFGTLKIGEVKNAEVSIIHKDKIFIKKILCNQYDRTFSVADDVRENTSIITLASSADLNKGVENCDCQIEFIDSKLEPLKFNTYTYRTDD